jgi:hypothetical protein
MPMLKDGEVSHKVVLLGPRGAATHFLEHRPPDWKGEGWTRLDGQGEVGEPPIDWASFNEPFLVGGTKHRAYFFGHGLASEDFAQLGEQTKTAMFKRMDHLLLVLDGAAPGFERSIGGEVGDLPSPISAVGIRGHAAGNVEIGGRTVAVTALSDGEVPGWLQDFLPLLANTRARPTVFEKPTTDALTSIVTANLARFHFATLTEPWELLLSPIWEPGPDGNAVRRVFLAPRSMRAHYFEGAARELLLNPSLGAIVAAMAQPGNPPPPLADVKALYCEPEAPFLEVAKVWTPAHGALSLLAADAARRARVGATAQQLLVNAPSPEQSKALLDIEAEYQAALGSAPVDELVRATADLARSRDIKRGKPWWKFW